MSAALPPSMRAMSSVLPERIGSYPIRGVIGTGSMGVVYLGHDPVIDRPVAVKTIQRHLLESSAGQDGAAVRFRVEARAAGRLSHRNIVSVHQFGEDPACAYIVMEYVRGHSLAEYLRRPERLAKAEVLCLMFQLLDALHYAHESGVVHRDIKPANLMVDRNGRLKVTDFGIARTDSGEVTRVNSVLGSPGYMAPEQYSGGPVDRRVDVFSAGVLLFQMLAGSKPFSGTDEEIMYQIVYGQHPSLTRRAGDPTLAVYEPVFDKALAKAPAQRFASALEFLDALKAVAGEAVAETLAPDRLLPFRPLDARTVERAPRSAAGESGSAASHPPSEAMPTGWDDTELVRLERDLTLHVGPVAKVLVRRAARGQVDISAVREMVASSIVDAGVRQRFLAGGDIPTSPSRARLAPAFVDTRPATSPRSETPLSREDRDRALMALTRMLGPMASVVVKRCADGAVSREKFVACVLEQVAARIDAKSLEAELWRSLT